MPKLEFNSNCSTNKAVEIFEKYKDAFGNIVSAEMKSNPEEAQYEFVLTNERKEQLIFDGGCTAGYVGRGPRGTLKILKMAGFDIEDDFAQTRASFVLTK